MNVWKYCRKMIVFVILLALLVTYLGNIGMAEEDSSEKYHEVFYSYYDKGTEVTCRNGFIYSDEFLLADANQFSGDIAKIAVSLSTLAYDRWDVADVLRNKMYYDILDDGSSYTRELSVFDCDHVAYTIARKQVGDNILYCIPIRGTHGNEEWFSNLCNMGSSDEHEGFSKAAREVLQELKVYLNQEQDKSKVRILITGHSRGAAAANLVAGWMTRDGVLPSGQIFGYTFACPYVSKNAKAYSNIYNFNNKGDLISEVPLKEWGYNQYGKPLSWAFVDNATVAHRFKEDTGKEYLSAGNCAGYKVIFEILGINSQVNSYFGVPQQLLLHLAANHLSGWKAPTLDMLDHAAYVVKSKDILERIKDSEGLEGMIAGLMAAEQAYNECKSSLLNIYSESQSWNSEEFSSFLMSNSWWLNDISAVVGFSFTSRQDFLSACEVLNSHIEECVALCEKAIAIRDLLSDTSGKLLTGIAHGHTMAGYLAQINYLYCGYRGYMGSDEESVIVPETTTSIGVECFKDSKVKTVEIPGTLVAVGTDAFAGLETVEATLPATIEYVGERAFMNCARITADDLQQLRYVKEQAFYGCPGIKKITIVPETEEIGRQAFFGCSGLNEVTIPVELSDFDTFDAACCNVESIHYTKGSTGIMDSAVWFEERTTLENYSREKLRHVDFGPGVVEIGGLRFDGCAALEEAIFPDTLEKIGGAAFANCTALKVVLPESLRYIDGAAFANCTAIETLVIPTSVEALSDEAFFGCSGLKELTIPVELSHLYAFDAACCNVNTIHYTKGSTGILEDRMYFTYKTGVEYYSRENLQAIDFEEGIVHIGSYVFGCNENSEGALTSVKLPSTLKSIGGRAFTNQKSLVDIELPEGLTEMGTGCFHDCALTSVTIPQTVNRIPEECFQECRMLSRIIIPDSVERIDDRAFLECESLKALVIPDSVSHIGDRALGGCSGLVELTIPVEVCYNNIADEQTCNVQKITYTANSTGIMPDRNFFAYVPHSLEYYSRDSLSAVEFAEGVTHIADYAFGLDYDREENPGVLEEVILPSTLQSVGWSAFVNQIYLSEIVFPQTLQKIGDRCFAGSGLSQIEFNGAAPVFGEQCFEKVTAVAYYPKGTAGWDEVITNQYGGEITWIARQMPIMLSDSEVRLFINENWDYSYCERKAFTVSVSSDYRDTPVSCVIDDPSVIKYENGELTGLKEGVAWITVSLAGEHEVKCRVEVKRIASLMEFPTHLMVIDGEAFANVEKAEMIVLPHTDFSVAENAFDGCEKLQAVVIHSMNAEISDSAFEGCGDIVIFCHDNSTALEFARRNRMDYTIIS